jgi:hypothetical protein
MNPALVKDHVAIHEVEEAEEPVCSSPSHHHRGTVEERGAGPGDKGKQDDAAGRG